MTGFDYAVLAVFGVSIVLGVLRGFVREVLSLASWAVAFVAAYAFAPIAAPLLPAAIASEPLRLLAAFLSLFFVTLLTMSLGTLALAQLVRTLGLGFVDRTLGLAFGIARAALIVVGAVLVSGLTELPRQPVWRDALLSPPLEALAVRLRPLLPEALRQNIRYPAPGPARPQGYTPRLAPAGQLPVTAAVGTAAGARCGEPDRVKDRHRCAESSDWSRVVRSISSSTTDC